MRSSKLVALAVILLMPAACVRRENSKAEHKNLNIPIDSDIRGFDPVFSSDIYTHSALAQVYQGLLQYSYLERPYKVEPLLAESLPEISEDGLTYTFRIREGVKFQRDEAFGGAARNLRASDFVYSLRRVMDPALKSPAKWLFDGKVSEVTAPDDRTLRITLSRPYRQLLFTLAMAPSFVVAPEVVEKYGKDFLNHPVGTGPFALKSWIRGQKLVFERNPDYWDERYPTSGGSNDKVEGRIPFLDQITFWIYLESQPKWLNFLAGNLDLTGIPKDARDSVFNENMTVKKEITERGITVQRSDESDLVYLVFNMDDPIVGRNPELRRAISAAIDRPQKIKLFYGDQARIAEGPIPPDIFGWNKDLRDPNGTNIELAKRLIPRAQELFLKNGGKGAIPPIRYDISSGTAARQMAEAMAADLDKIGVKLEIRSGSGPQLFDRLSKGQSQFAMLSWNADYPDPENFLQLLYGGNGRPGPNRANFKNTEYDALYEKMRNMPDSPERFVLIQKMVSIIHREVPWVLLSHRVAYPAKQAWVRNYMRHAMSPGLFKYLDVDLKSKEVTLPRLK